MSEPAASPVEEAIRARFPDVVTGSALAVDVPTLSLNAARLREVAGFVRDELGYTMPILATGIDLKTHMDAVWHVLNLRTGHFLALRVTLDREAPRTPSLTPVWPGMDWHEREAYDLLGIHFEDHPDLRRILLPDDWEGHPLRKDYTAID